jgi:hypothetical protein
MSFIINWKTHIKCILLSIVITIILYHQFNNIIGSFLEYKNYNLSNYNTIIYFYACVILIMIPLSVFHELIHGITFKILGGKVIYGFRGIYAYTQEVSGKKISRNLFLIVLLMPLTLISILCFLINSEIFSMVFLLNLLGSSGDIYLGFTLARYSSKSFIVDRKYGYDVIIDK